jgi:hypothetical protein
MNNRYALAIVVIAALVAAFVLGASVAPGRAKPVDEKKPDAAVGHKTAVFNTAAIMRDFHYAKYQL